MIVNDNQTTSQHKSLQQIFREKRKQLNPPQFIVIVFAILIMVGTILLMLPISSSSGRSIGFLNALFTAVSAVCVNGLSILEVGEDFTRIGQVIIMTLIQIGGLGFMTISVAIAILLGKKIGLKERLLIQQTTQSTSTQGLVRLSIHIVIIVFAFESIATAILTWHWHEEMGLETALFYALFHSISSFNNAGFSLWPDGLSSFVGDPIVNFTVIILFVAGGLGFIVIVDLFKKRSWRKLSTHSKIVISSTLIITAIGFLLLLLLENYNAATFGSLTWYERIQSALFQSLTPRSVGFNTLPVSDMLAASQFLIIIFMFIGAASGGTGGGVKINTIVILILATIASFRGEERINAFQRRIPQQAVMRALAVIMISMACVLVIALALTITENILERHFLEVLFEATSAFSTTGLSMGLTKQLSLEGKIIVCISMFVGRLGPLTLAYALAKRKPKSKLSYPEDNILIG